MKIGQSAGKSWAYLVGVYLGDGCVTHQWTERRQKRTCFRLNTIDQDFADATKAALQEHTKMAICQSAHSVSKSSKQNHTLWCGDAALCDRLVIETDAKDKLPDWIWTVSQDEKLEFIAGLMDSEGYAAVNPKGQLSIGFKSCDVWFHDFIRVLNSAGIEVGKIGIEKPRKPGYKTPRRFTVRRQSWLDSKAYFKIQRKQRRVTEWHASQLTSETNTRDAA